MPTVTEVRKMLFWGLPFLVGMAVFCYWIFFDFVMPEIRELLEQAPAVRIGPMGYLMPFIGIMAVLLVPMLILRAIPYEGKIFRWLELAQLGVIFGSFVLMVLIACTSTLVQSYGMPKLGYSRCSLLEGNPTMWFTDWVKNPAWCVRGKSREWVREQAGVAKPAEPELHQ